MNASSKPILPKIESWLTASQAKLRQAGIESARLDAELLLADAMNQDRSWLVAHCDELIKPESLALAESNLARRLERIPLAYIRNWIEFYGRHFLVSTDTLIPRPESETAIDLVRDLHLPPQSTIIDVGTGSGCIGISLSLELPEQKVVLTDIDKNALGIARKNCDLLKCSASTLESDLLANPALPKADCIVANLPYVANHEQISPEAIAEPRLALFAEDSGYELIERLITQAHKHLDDGGYLVLEMNPWQRDRVARYGQNCGFCEIRRTKFYLVLAKQN